MAFVRRLRFLSTRTRAHLLTSLAEISARKQKQAPEEFRLQLSARAAKRNKKMALEYLSEREKNKSISPSALMAKIGKRHDLKRSAAIAGIKQGLKDRNGVNCLEKKAAKKIVQLTGELDENGCLILPMMNQGICIHARTNPIC